MAKLTREEIMERLQTVGGNVVNSRTALFAAVPSGKIRSTVHFEKLTGTTYSAVFPYVPIAPTDVRQLPPTNYDIENPIITCEDATLLYATANAGTPYAAVIYWDNER